MDTYNEVRTGINSPIAELVKAVDLEAGDVLAEDNRWLCRIREVSHVGDSVHLELADGQFVCASLTRSFLVVV